MKRRNFLKGSILACGATVAEFALPTSVLAAARKNILVLGGTSFLGPATVEAALVQGHNVTLFNRGVTNPDLFPQLEKLHGFRSLDPAKQNLSALNGERTWDAIIDVWPHEPTVASSIASLLKDRTHHYLYVSSIAAYSSVAQINLTEDTPIRPFNGDETDYSFGKAESERRLEGLIGNKLTIVRPGPIHGPRDGSPDMLSWLLRAQSGGQHIGPGEGHEYVQNIDVKDIAHFLIMAIDRHITGTFNLTGHPMSFREYLAACNDATDSNAEWIWVTQSFLVEQGLTDRKWFLAYVPDPARKGLFQISSEKAFQAGWQPRPFRETAMDILGYYRTPNSITHEWRDPLAPEKEQAVLNAWKQRST